MDSLEKIIRPIVEGQIRGFMQEHPSILQAVDWYKIDGRDPAAIFIGSLSKRIIRDLTCGSTTARLAKVFLESGTEAPLNFDCGTPSCGEGGQHGTVPVLAAAPVSNGSRA